jgi:hypothetical protein
LYQQRANTAASTAAAMDLAAGYLTASHIKDPRIVNPAEPPLLTLSDAALDPIVAGRKANFILDPHTTPNDFRRNRALMNEAQLDTLQQHPGLPQAPPSRRKN